MCVPYGGQEQTELCARERQRETLAIMKRRRRKVREEKGKFGKREREKKKKERKNNFAGRDSGHRDKINGRRGFTKDGMRDSLDKLR